MLTPHMGAAGSPAAAKAMAAYYLEQQIPTEAMRLAAYYGQTHGVEEAIAQGCGVAPLLRNDIDPALAEALGLKPGQTIDVDALANILTGLKADGTALPVQHQHRDVRTYGDAEGGKARHRVAYIDLTLSAPKHLSVAWAFAKTEAERNSLLHAHQIACDKALRYVEQQAVHGRLGNGGMDGAEPARMAWIKVDHYTARPTLARVCTDPSTGEAYTELTSAKVAGDPAIHTHCLIPNLIRTESGRFVAIDASAFHGRIKEFGAVYQAFLAHELTAMGVAVDLDPLTNMARLPAIPEHVVDEFSKRTREGEAAARTWAERHGLDWDEMSDEQRASFQKLGTHATRQDKETNTPDMEAWKKQAERIGWRHDTVIGAVSSRTKAERMDQADQAGLPHLEEMLTKSAVIGQGQARTAIARGFIAAGGLADGAEIGEMARHWAKHGVVQDGRETKLIWKEVERGQVKITTELHRDQEIEFIALARKAVADRGLALTSDKIAAAVERTGVSYAGRGGNSQREAVETIGTDGGLSVLIGVAGSRKSTGVLIPLVDEWKRDGLTVWGTAQAWRQAKALKSAGIDGLHTRALDPLLTGIAGGRTKVDRNSIIVLDEVARVGTRQLLELLRLRDRHEFKVVAIGDDKQAVAIEAGPVVDLLRRALGEERIPQLLETVRQEQARERDIAALWRSGAADKAIAAKREDGTAELVQGGYREAVERVAEIYAERRKATADRADYSITISAPTNHDAHEISRLVRERRRDLGEVGKDVMPINATDGQGVGRTLNLAVGDHVRLFARTRGIFTDTQGYRKSAVVGDNGSVLTVTGIDRNNGLHVAGESGKTAFVTWEALRDKSGTGRVKLAYGDVLTIDTAQGITSDEHIGAMPGGSSAITSGKAYVIGSRHTTRSYLVGSMGTEMREAQGRRMSGLPQPGQAEATAEAWSNLTRNLSRITRNESALDLLETVAVVKRCGVRTLQGALRRHEAREAQGQSATTVLAQRDIAAVGEALPEIAEGLAAMAMQQAETAQRAEAITAAQTLRERQYKRVEITEIEAQQQFAEALARHGLRLKTLPIMDGQLHYAPVDGNRGSEKSGAYKGFYDDDRPPSGAIYNWKHGGFVGTWTARGETIPVSAEEHAERLSRAAEKAAAQQHARAEREAAGAGTAVNLIADAAAADASHPYLQQKGVDAHGIYIANPGQTISIKGSDGIAREYSIAGRLLVPLRNAEGEIRNVQVIAADGTKLYLQGAQKIGTFHILGQWTPGEAIGIAEGYATAATGHRAMDMPVAMALDTSNLTAVAIALRQASPDGPVFMLADNDHHLPMRNPPLPNQGKEKAEKAAEAASAVVLLAPELPERAMVGKGTDWNDYEVRRGHEAVKSVIGAQIQSGKAAAPSDIERQIDVQKSKPQRPARQSA